VPIVTVDRDELVKPVLPDQAPGLMLVALAGHGELKSFVRANQQLQLPDPRLDNLL
jgi:hypothetical protein